MTQIPFAELSEAWGMAIGLVDGSVQGFSKSRLQEALVDSGDSGNAHSPVFSLKDGAIAQVNCL